MGKIAVAKVLSWVPADIHRDLPSPNDWRNRIKKQNDGSLPREPYQRCSQAIFEAWLKPRIQASPLIDSYFGLEFETLVESGGGVEARLTHVRTGEVHLVRAQYVVGCDGAGSQVRSAIGGQMIGGPVPMAMYLVHFKSRDLATLHKQGQFWHIFFSHGGVLISQDEVDTWTAHLPISLDTDWETLDPVEVVQAVLGGSAGPLSIKIDQVLVRSVWRPKICVADRYRSSGGNVLLAGDAAHQNIPTGGYGMNTAVGDSIDVGWKLAAIVKGYGGPYLLDAYEAERRPVAVANIERSGVHHSVHQEYVSWVQQAGPGVVTAQDDKGQALRRRIADFVLTRDGENQDHGIELGYRYDKSPIVVADPGASAPEWNYRNYRPSTAPGCRPPHVFLADGKTSVFDCFGADFTLVDFSAEGSWAALFAAGAARLGIPLKTVHLCNQDHAAAIWERPAVLIRPDDHVAWRAPQDGSVPDVEQILNTATGRESAPLDGASGAAGEEE